MVYIYIYIHVHVNSISSMCVYIYIYYASMHIPGPSNECRITLRYWDLLPGHTDRMVQVALFMKKCLRCFTFLAVSGGVD